MPTNDHDLKHDPHAHTPEEPGYEVSDVNVNGVIVFVTGLFGFLAVFFVVCFVLGKLINGTLIKSDGPVDKWHQLAGVKTTRERENLTTNPDMEQRVLQQVSKTFPEPRLDMDDGNQATADLHSREDLMLDYYSSTPGQDAIRIPISRAMELIAQRGLPVHAEPAGSGTLMAGEEEPVVQAPLTDGFARTGYEQQVIEARKQKMDFGKAQESEHAALVPVK
ncbi:MAG: hypothetical protein JSS95_09965 [Acidobacteria bacterium]|nr:hypothetical protein [Acidobacteriota bacterium]